MNQIASKTDRQADLFYMLRVPLFIAAFLFLLKSLFVLSTPIENLGTTSWLIDDSFIMATISRNLGTGCGYSFNCVTPTSGAPLIWTSLVAPYHAVLQAAPAMKLTIINSALVGSICTLLVYYLSYILYGSRVAIMAFILATFSLSLFVTPMNGMETALFALTGLIAITFYASKFCTHKVATISDYLIIGILLGLLNLTRGDGVFLSFAIISVEMLLLLSNVDQRHARLVGMSILIGTTAGISMILILWSLYTNEVLLPANQSGRRFIALNNVMDDAYNIIWEKYNRRVVFNFYSLSKLIAATVGTGILALLSLVWPYQKQDRLIRLVVLLYIVSFVMFLAIYQQYFPDLHGLRYMVFPGYLFAIFLANAAVNLASKMKRVRNKNFLVNVITVLLLFLSFWHYQNTDGGLPVIPIDGDTVWRTQLNDWVNENLDAGTRFAAKDHGQLAYFTQVEVVDLAGIIQPELVDRLKSGDLPSFLAENEVEYILLNRNSNHRVFTEAYATLDLGEPVYEIQQENSNAQWQVYQIKP